MIKKRLIYLPLERYRERYTEFLSGKDGMFEKQCRKLGIKILALRPSSELNSIKHGVVLDTVARCKWAFAQTTELVRLIFDGKINPKTDVLYIEDFWHPGFEMIPYALHLKFGDIGYNKWPNIYSFCHAQSVDPHDFTHSMRSWMRDIETAFGFILTGIFCAAPEMKDMIVNPGSYASGNPDPIVYSTNWVHATGTVFDSSVLKRIRGPYKVKERRKEVIWSSRWDTEKCPGFFMDLFDHVRYVRKRKDILFTVVTGAAALRSNDQNLINRARAMDIDSDNDGQFEIVANCSKQKYYQLLSAARVQFNAADQDFVSYTLLEATTFGCAPLYPNYLTFPAALDYAEEHLYAKNDINDAADKLLNLIDNYPLLGSSNPPDFSFVYKKYEQSVERMANVMGLIDTKPDSLEHILDEKVLPDV